MHLSILQPWALGPALAAALLSSAPLYSLEMEAIKRFSSRAFSILLSATPAIVALAGFLALGEHFTLLQWGAMLCIMAASVGSATSVRPPGHLKVSRFGALSL